LKELGTGLLLGACYGAITGVVAWFMFPDLGGGTLIGQTVGISIWLNITLASLIGPGLPMLLQKLSNNPTLVTGPYLGSLLDLIAIFNYFLVAELLLP
jgi:magnesium transporter